MMNQVWFLGTIMKLMMVLSVLVYASSAAKYTVGGQSGWALDSDVQSWSSSNSFSVGDTLEFMYKPVHSVLEVNKLAYEACDSANPISLTNGNYTSVTLDTPGTRYFICGAQGHCSSGLKVKIVVSSTDPSRSGGRRSPRRPPTSGGSPPAPRQSPPPPSNTPGTPPSRGPDFPPSDPTTHGPSGSPSAATKITHQFVAPSVICLVLIKLMIIN